MNDSVVNNAAVLLEVKGLSVDLSVDGQRVPVVESIDLRIRAGETLALVGESGCGKSMTALALMRLLPEGVATIQAGSVHLQGLSLLELSERGMQSVRGGRIGMIFQDPMSSLNPVMTAGRQIAEVLRLHTPLRGHAMRSRVCDLLDLVGIPSPEVRCREYPHQLSGGMKQRVMIAMALAGEPDVLIADEPTTALDVTIQAQILALLQRLQKERGLGMLLVTHDLGVVRQVADHVAVMYAGELVESAPVADFMHAAAHPYSQALFAALPNQSKRDTALQAIPGMVPGLEERPVSCRFAARCTHVRDVCSQAPVPLHEYSSGHRVRCVRAGEVFFTDAAVPAGEVLTEASIDQDTLLDIRALQVVFRGKRRGWKKPTLLRAVDGVDLCLQRGKTLALVGESGCGKTTVGKALLGLVSGQSKQLHFDGALLDLARAEDLRHLRRSAQMVFQDAYASMNPRMSLSAIIAEGLWAQKRIKTAKQEAEQVRVLLHQVGLPASYAMRYPHELSGGQRQRVCIARALAVAPALLICDEPTSALDVSIQAQILNLMKSLQRDLGMSYLFITHNLGVVEFLADEVAVMYLGRIVEQGTVQQVLTHPRHPYTRLLLDSVPRLEGALLPAESQRATEMPSPLAPPSGCHFHPRCAYADTDCRQNYPDARSDTDRYVRCFHPVP